MADALRGLTFPEKEGGSTFIKFKADVAQKLRVYTTDPLISIDQYGNTRYSFAVWNYEEGKAMLLSKGKTIAEPIVRLHNDPDYGEDITQVDIKILPTGEELERKYQVNVLPKAQTLTPEQEAEVTKLDGKMEEIIPNGIRASAYNKGEALPSPVVESGTPISDDEIEGVDLSTIFPED